MEHTEVLRHASATVIAELVFAGRDGTVAAAVVTPLTDERGVVVALPYAQRGLADALADAPEVALVSSDARLTLGGWEPVAVHGRIEVVADPEGAWFKKHLVEEELRKHPPSRLLANSLRDRRDHWWYMPRLLCRLTAVRGVHPVTPRDDPAHGVLAWRSEGLRVDTVAVEPMGDGDLRLRSLAGGPIVGSSEQACLVRHDFSRPDFERTSALMERGRLEGDALRVTEREGALDLPGPPGLLARVRRHRALSRACRRELARARS